MNPTVKEAASEEDFYKCREVLRTLRPHISEEFFFEAIRKTIEDNRRLIFIEENGKGVSVLVFEWGYNLFRGKYIYIDDLSSLPEARGKGYASLLLDWVIDYARINGFDQVHLDSGVNEGRWDAHRLYLKKRFNVTSLHFAIKLK
ncbi:MAG: GNAT family N-acetyltransferase [Chitinophagales bacterium]